MCVSTCLWGWHICLTSYKKKKWLTAGEGFFYYFQPISRSLNPPKGRFMPHQQTTDHLVNQWYDEQLQTRLRNLANVKQNYEWNIYGISVLVYFFIYKSKNDRLSLHLQTKKCDLFSRAELVIWQPIRRWVPSTCFDSFSYWHRDISSSVTHTQKNVRHSPASKKIINIFQRWTDIVKKYTHTHTHTHTHTQHTHNTTHTTSTHLSVVQIFPGRPVPSRDI